MNWKRIGMGAAAAAAVLWLIEGASYGVALGFQNLSWGDRFRAVSMPMASQLIPNLVGGFLQAWFYALARPRLGPGPKTALLIGTCGWAMAIQPLFSPMAWMSNAGMTAIFAALAWIKYVGATLLAGWLYIEKAP